MPQETNTHGNGGGRDRSGQVLAGLIVVGLFTLGALALFGVPSPGVLDQGTAFLVLGGALILLAPAVIGMIFAVKETKREVDDQTERTDRRLQRLEQEVGQVTGPGGVRGQAIEQALESQARMIDRVLEEQDKRLETRTQAMVEALDRHEAHTRRLIDEQATRIDEKDRPVEAILEHQASMFSELMTRQDEIAADQRQALERALQVQEQQMSELVHRQEALIEELAEETPAPGSPSNGSSGLAFDGQPRYPVARYRIQEIPGLKASAARKLSSQGVNLTDTLLHADLAALAEATDLEPEQLQRWRDTAELMSIDGLGPELSERLVAAGIRSIPELARMSPEELSDTLMESYETDPDHHEVVDRTLPGRSSKIIDQAREAAHRLAPAGGQAA